MTGSFALALLCMIVSIVSFSFVGVVIRYSTSPLMQMIFVRDVFMLISVLILNRGPRRARLWGHKKNRPLLILRGFTGFFGVGLYMYTIRHLPLASAVMLSKLAPFFVIPFAALILHERRKFAEIAALLLALAGAALVIKPVFSVALTPALGGVAGAMIAAFSFVLIRHLNGREPVNTILFYFAVIGCLITVIPALRGWQNVSWKEALLLLGIGALSAVGQQFMTMAFRYAPVSKITLYDYLGVFLSALLGLLFFDEIPDSLSIIGSLLIIAVSAGLYFYQKHKPDKEAS